MQEAELCAVLEAARHLLQLVTSLLDRPRIYPKRAAALRSGLTAQTIAAECLDLFRPAAEMKGLSVSMAMSTGVHEQQISDSMSLRVVLLHLLGNAVKYTDRGAVKLLLTMTTSMLRAEVADTGPGISVQQGRRISQYFERPDDAAEKQVDGVGLGLALSDRLVRLMGGRLGHQANPEGGTVFWVEVPPEATALLVTPTTEALKASRLNSRGHALKILIVDDTMMHRDLMKAVLVSSNHECICASGGEAAVEFAKNEDFDVILMDIRMPGMDGLEAARRIRSIGSARGNVPILAVTAQDHPEHIQKCRRAGMDGHLAKPWEPAALLASVSRAASARQAHNEKLAWLGSAQVGPPLQ